MACVMTSSPTRLMSWSTFSTDTRNVLDSGFGAGLSARGAAARAGAADAAGPGTAAADSSAGAPGALSKKP